MRDPAAIRCPWWLVCAAAIATLSALGTAGANDELAYRPIRGASPEPLPAVGLTDRAQLEGFMDGLIPLLLESKPAAGAVVAVVKDGELFFAKGYGYADVEKRIPMSPERTLIRPGSTGKLFTWTAVMQLVEQGKLDLDMDVNTYLRQFKIPATQPAPVTLRNLMTHSAGFEEGFLGYVMARSEAEYVPLHEFLSRHVPARARVTTTNFADGTSAAYSNWSAALAGHIVETVSGVPFDDYVEQNIFQPLGMSSTTFREPLPPALAERMSVGYEFVDGVFEPQEFERWHNDAPAGSASATAIDMAKFMLAHLQGGAVGGARVLRPETVSLMHVRALSSAPMLNGMTLGFFDTWINGRHVISHGGATLQFRSMLSLIPEANLGLFVSFNTAGAGKAAEQVERAFMDHYFPATLPKIAPRLDAAERAERYVGSYRTLRRSYTKIDKVLFAPETFKVTAGGAGTLYFEHPDTPSGPAYWVEVAEGVFRHPSEAAFVVFRENGDGRMHMLGPDPVHPNDRLSWYEEPALQLTVLGISLLLFTTILVSAVRERLAGHRADHRLRWARPVLASAAALLLTFLILLTLSLGETDQFIFDFPSATLLSALALPLLAIPPTLAAVVFTGIAWRQDAWTPAARLHYTAATLAVLAFLLMLGYWNLLGYQFG